MKLAIVGATGFVGSRLLDEALLRGHEVAGICRTAQPARPRVRWIAAEVADTAALAAAFAGCVAVLHAYAPPRSAADAERIALQSAATGSIISALHRAGVRRVLAVGGAGTLEVAPGVRFMDSYAFPQQWLGGARSTAVIKDLLAAEPGLDWVFLSPPNLLEPGVRTGRYRIGKDRLLVDAVGRSAISVEDYAVAMIDELETPQHHRERFTVGY